MDRGGAGTTSAMEPCVLLVDPSHAIQCLLRRSVEEQGAVLLVAEDVTEAMATICQRQPIVVLTTLELTGFPGASLVAAMKSSPTHRGIPVAVVTASVESVARKLGPFQADGVIRKDVELASSAKEFLASYGVVQPTVAAASEANGVGELHGRRILLCDDSKLNLVLYERMLRNCGAVVVAVDSGPAVLAATASTLFDLILLDIEMPHMDGRETLAALRQNGWQRPVVALTAHEADKFRDEAVALGFDDTLTKPIKQAALSAACLRTMAGGVASSR